MKIVHAASHRDEGVRYSSCRPIFATRWPVKSLHRNTNQCPICLDLTRAAVPYHHQAQGPLTNESWACRNHTGTTACALEDVQLRIKHAFDELRVMALHSGCCFRPSNAERIESLPAVATVQHHAKPGACLQTQHTIQHDESRQSGLCPHSSASRPIAFLSTVVKMP